MMFQREEMAQQRFLQANIGQVHFIGRCGHLNEERALVADDVKGNDTSFWNWLPQLQLVERGPPPPPCSKTWPTITFASDFLLAQQEVC